VVNAIPNLRLGTQGFAYKDWLGVFYPAGTPATEYLRFYSRVFDTLELDTTFYGPPRSEVVESWRESTPDDFVFSAKMPRTITHDKRLVAAEPELVEFLTAIQALGPKLGPILIQLPPSFTRAEAASLAAFAEILPEEFRYAVELRHPSWLVPSTADILERHRLAWTVIDLVSMPHAVHLTADFAYVRWLGNREDVKRLNQVVVDRLTDFDRWSVELDHISRKVQRIYGYVNNHYAGHSPASVNDLKRRVGQQPVQPESLWDQQTLALDA
jgi:uncharacterized protein YecE (DUF72 family)